MKWGLFFLFIALTLLNASILESSQTHYIPPPNVAMSLSLMKGTRVDDGSFLLRAKLEGRVGTLTEMKIFFESSADFKVEPAVAALKTLAKGKSSEFDLRIAKTSGKPDAGGSWVRMRVVYLPDYQALTRMMSNVKRYPDEIDRGRMLGLFEMNCRKKSFQTDSTRFFPLDR